MYKIVLATSVTFRNLDSKEESLTSLKKFFSTWSLVFFSLNAVSSRNFFEPSDRVEPGTIVFTVTFVPFVSLAKPLEKTFIEALDLAIVCLKLQ